MSEEQMIHEAAMEILGEVGVKIHNERAVEILQENGIRVEDSIAFFSEEQVMEWVSKAPESFTIYARNPRYDALIGGSTSNVLPTYGCAFVDDWEGNRRRGTMADYLTCLKLIQAEEIYSFNGGILVQPGDVAEEFMTLLMFYATITHSDKAIILPTGFKNEVELALQACAELYGGKEELAQKPRVISLINTVSPLALDARMLDCLMLLADYGQPAIICPAAMLGATSPVTIAGTLASNTAEVLAGIALTQMIRPGTPVVFGIQSTAADFRGVTFACAAPEGTIMQGFAARMGRFYHLPSRGGGCQTDAPLINCQAGYESMLTFSSAYRNGINVILEAGGVMDSVNATSFEKMVIDFEIIRQVQVACKPFEVNEQTLDLATIKEMAHTGSFVMSDTTLDNYRELYTPHVGPRSEAGADYFKQSVDAEMKRLLEKYNSEQPVLDTETLENLKALLVQAGIKPQDLEAIDAL